RGASSVVPPHDLATDAQVGTGAKSIIVQSPADSYHATVVLIDSDLDVALLHTDGVRAPPLTFTSTGPRRGTLAASIGFPGGGNETVEPATVAAAYYAQGLSVSGDSRVTRRIIELRARVRPGDSGGPL